MLHAPCFKVTRTSQDRELFQKILAKTNAAKTTDLGEKLDLLHLVLDLRELSQPAVIAVKGSVF
ncbi:hypothetical protein, partial [Marivita hallyeonensis]|uniref:hypothetical protein n=1 Tax=Marivita hallyeonensis TaxID=996342 RepID=UPI001C4A6527